uniref:Apolipoprotein L domain containing 1a n=1 Tax=Scleropages formosus TaxID=113540 RepID=A0A8C9RUN4_SCLFO
MHRNEFQHYVALYRKSLVNMSSPNSEASFFRAVQEAADRVYMAARLFVSLLDQRNESLKARVAELRTVADAADSFHKRTVAASVGGGVASVAGSVTTITGLILAPFTFGTSLIVTGVGIGVATAGGLTTASANITDTVHSKLDRKKVEKMIQGYQEDMQDIKECLEFVQVGQPTFLQSLSRHALNQNVKHVIKEGGRAGKALVINTENLVSTVQVFSAAGGAARAAQAISVTTGVMSALFLALDIFFLAKNSHELRAGAKTKFAAKIREVCEELDEGLVELNQIKAELQKTMEGDQKPALLPPPNIKTFLLKQYRSTAPFHYSSPGKTYLQLGEVPLNSVILAAHLVSVRRTAW